MKPASFFTKIRLSLYFPIFFILFWRLIDLTHYRDNQALLIIFLACSLVFVLYILPLLGELKRRIEKLTSLIREESLVFYKAKMIVNDLKPEINTEFTERVLNYLERKNHNVQTTAAEDEYLALLAFCKKHRKDTGEVFIHLTDNESNRAQIAMYLRNKIFGHEWSIVLALYIATVILMCTVTPHNIIAAKIAVSLFGASLSIMVLSLWKLNNLTHKRAWQIWGPFVKMIATKFQQLD